MSKDRSLKFEGGTGPKPYQANIRIKGGVTGVEFGHMLLTRNDLVALSKLCNHLVMVSDAQANAMGVIS